MTLDDVRMRFPTLGFALYAYEPFGQVTLEVHDRGDVYTFTGFTEADALAKAFPEPQVLQESKPPPVDEQEGKSEPQPSVFD